MVDKFTPSSNQQANAGKTPDLKDPWASGLRSVLDSLPLPQNHAAVKPEKSGTTSNSSMNKASVTFPPKQQSSWLKTVLLQQDVEIRADTSTSSASNTSQTTAPVLLSSLKTGASLHQSQPCVPSSSSASPGQKCPSCRQFHNASEFLMKNARQRENCSKCARKRANDQLARTQRKKQEAATRISKTKNQTPEVIIADPPS
jgi:hypothetical protein